jgi:flagellar biosynthesis protein FlhB
MKTEEPTPRRLRKAREEGDSPVSQALGQGAGLLVALFLVPLALGATAVRAADLYRAALTGLEPERAPALLAIDVVTLSAPLLGAVAFVALALGIVQTEGAMGTRRLAPDLTRLNPIEGLKNLFRLERVLSVLRALVAGGVVAWYAWTLLTSHAVDFAESSGNAYAAVPLIDALARKLGWAAAAVGLVLGLADLVIVRRAWRQRHRMSKDEVRREYRESEGDPELKAKRKRAHQEALAGSIVNAVKDATVVIVNPTHLACALRYVEAEDGAPTLVAQGQGELARRIVEAAHAYGIPCVRDIPVARALAELEIGDEIPEALYEAVAEILREVFDGEQKSG